MQTRAVTTLLIGATILVVGQGLLLALIPLKLEAMGVGVQNIAAIAATYFVGFLVGAWWGERIIRTVGHIRAYGGLIALVILSTLGLALMHELSAWIAMRLMHGLAAGAAFLAIESWLTVAATGTERGRILAAYMVCTLGALGGSQLLVGSYDITTSDLFVLGGMIYAASIFPVMLTQIDGPQIMPAPSLSIRSVFATSPFAAVTSFAAGAALGGFWALGPVFGAENGLEADQVSILMASAIFAGLVLQWPTARLSDRTDRRRVVLGLTVIATAAAVAMLFPAARSTPTLYACFGFVGSTFCLYPIAVAHAIDASRDSINTMQVSRGLLLANGLGLAVGPFAAGECVVIWKDLGLMVFFAAVLGSVAVVTAIRISVRRAPAAGQKEKFVFLRANTPAGNVIDPRTDEPPAPMNGQPATG